MWSLPEDLEEWFDEVERKHKERYGDDSDDVVDESGWVQNDLARGMRDRNR